MVQWEQSECDVSEQAECMQGQRRHSRASRPTALSGTRGASLIIDDATALAGPWPACGVTPVPSRQLCDPCLPFVSRRTACLARSYHASDPLERVVLHSNACPRPQGNCSGITVLHHRYLRLHCSRLSLQRLHVRDKATAIIAPTGTTQPICTSYLHVVSQTFLLPHFHPHVLCCTFIALSHFDHLIYLRLSEQPWTWSMPCFESTSEPINFILTHDNQKVAAPFYSLVSVLCNECISSWSSNHTVTYIALSIASPQNRSIHPSP